MPSNNFTFNPSKTGLERTLGPLEAAIVTAVWSREGKPINTSDVLDIVNDQYKRLRYTTVASTLTRLVAKGLLNRKMTDNGSYEFTAKETQGEYSQRTIYAIMDSLLTQDEDDFNRWIFEFEYGQNDEE